MNALLGVNKQCFMVKKKEQNGPQNVAKIVNTGDPCFSRGVLRMSKGTLLWPKSCLFVEIYMIIRG